MKPVRRRFLGLSIAGAAAAFNTSKDVGMRRALLLALGEAAPKLQSPGLPPYFDRTLIDLYRNDPDSGIHGAAKWLLHHWGLREGARAVAEGRAADRVGHRSICRNGARPRADPHLRSEA